MKKIILAGALAGSFLFSNNALAADYTVKSGDSLWKISNANNVTVANLKTWNNLTSDTIYPGQVLKISNEFTGNNTSATHVVVKGDTFYSIAKKYNMSMSALQALNPQITNINLIYIGQTINISGGASSNSGSSNNSSSNSGSTSSSWEVKADSIIATAKKYIGADYLYGASTSQTDAFDCSSYTQRVFQENGITLPRTSVEQSKMGQAVSFSNVRKGDLIFFDTDYDGVINHVGIAISSTSMIHCGSSTGVTISSINSYWSPRISKVTRVF
ncbi:MAG: LysM peptidoglycan-binding domain-containing protein [Bacillus sp. (in: firmicutes)]